LASSATAVSSDGSVFHGDDASSHHQYQPDARRRLAEEIDKTLVCAFGTSMKKLVCRRRRANSL
jgi:hypothetical protein